MDLSFYSDPEIYDLAFRPGAFEPFYVRMAEAQGGAVLELGCGTGQLLAPLARKGYPAIGLDSSLPMLERARDLAPGVDFVEGDMRSFDIGRQFDLIFVARNTLLHLHTVDDLRSCFACVRRHLRPGGAFAFDVFNPNVSLLANTKTERSVMMELSHPTRGRIIVEQTSDYDAAAQVNRATVYFSSPDTPDFLVAPLHLRSIFPQELPLLLQTSQLTLESRWGGFSREPFTSDSAHQVCVCRSA